MSSCTLRKMKVNLLDQNSTDKNVKRENYKIEKKPPSRLMKLFLTCVVLFSAITILIGYHATYYTTSYKAGRIDDLFYTFGGYKRLYAIIIDAGSTGSRVHSLCFYKSILTGSVKLQDDLFVHTKPGLSDFASDPKKGAEKIMELVETAKEFIPKQSWKDTPIALRATAGLRLLPTEKADKLLEEVRNSIAQSPFLNNKRSVSIMDGKDEGIFSWFTVNFLLDHLNKDITKSVVTLDLGGGSIQITFIPFSSQTFKESSASHLHQVEIMNKQIDAYSYSYLGLGLMAVRYEAFLQQNQFNKTHAITSCLRPEVHDKEWIYGGRKYYISGKEANEFDTTICRNIVKNIVLSKNVDKPSEIEKHEIVAFSYFFDRAVDANIIERSKGGTVTIDDFENAIETVCGAVNERPFLCMDLIVILSLLKYGFGLDNTIPIQLLDTIDGHEISWGLGAAFHILENGL